MSGSDTESSCGWTIISNEGSDIETLGTEAVEDVQSATVNSVLQKVTLPDGDHGEVKEDTFEVTLVDAGIVETLDPEETGINAASNEHVSVLSSSDHSDILTLGDLKEDEPVTAEAEELYLGMSCSSQYTFTSAQTVFPVQPLVVPHLSSSEEEPDSGSGAVVRRRRVRRNTPTTMTEPNRDEVTESDQSERGETPQEQSTAQGETQRQGSNVLTTCILLMLIIAISSGFGHFYGTNQIQIQERQFVDEIELNGLRDLIFYVGEQKGDLSLNDLDVQKAITVLSEAIDKIRKEKEDLSIKHAQIQAQRDELVVLLKKTAEDKSQIESQHQSLVQENYDLKHSLQKEERSLSVLQEELRTLRLTMKDLEILSAEADSLQSENQRLKAELEEEKEAIRSISGKREGLMIEAQTLRKTLDDERKVTDELRGEIHKLRQQINGVEKAKDLQSRLMELEKRLSFEQQRSDLWERLYLETKKERAKGDSDPDVKKLKSKQGMAGKVKETFDAVKNSTKEFVHHHKERIKKAKEAVKDNLRKFSDSVKSTFRNFKDSASTIFNKARGFYNKRHTNRNTDETWQHRSGKQAKKPFKFNFDFFQSNHFARNSADEVHEKFKPQSCSEVFDCAYQEFMSLFNQAAGPIRADEFYQLLQSYLQKEVDHFPYWKELERFIKNFFQNGLFIHDQMLFTDFVNDVEGYLTDLYMHQGLNEDFFEDLDDYIYRHFFGKTYSKNSRPSGPFEGPNSKEDLRGKHRRKEHGSKHDSERKWNKADQNRDRHMADVKIELGPMPLDPKY